MQQNNCEMMIYIRIIFATVLMLKAASETNTDGFKNTNSKTFKIPCDFEVPKNTKEEDVTIEWFEEGKPNKRVPGNHEILFVADENVHAELWLSVPTNDPAMTIRCVMTKPVFGERLFTINYGNEKHTTLPPEVFPAEPRTRPATVRSTTTKTTLATVASSPYEVLAEVDEGDGTASDDNWVNPPVLANAEYGPSLEDDSEEYGPAVNKEEDAEYGYAYYRQNAEYGLTPEEDIGEYGPLGDRENAKYGEAYYRESAAPAEGRGEEDPVVNKGSAEYGEAYFRESPALEDGRAEESAAGDREESADYGVEKNQESAEYGTTEYAETAEYGRTEQEESVMPLDEERTGSCDTALRSFLFFVAGLLIPVVFYVAKPKIQTYVGAGSNRKPTNTTHRYEKLPTCPEPMYVVVDNKKGLEDC